MTADLKARWVAALRSGHYKQGRRRLHQQDTNTYCCLGVLCEMMNCQDLLREGLGVMAYLMLHDVSGLTRAEAQTLIHMNDYEGNTFNQIADHVESRL